MFGALLLCVICNHSLIITPPESPKDISKSPHDVVITTTRPLLQHHLVRSEQNESSLRRSGCNFNLPDPEETLGGAVARFGDFDMQRVYTVYAYPEARLQPTCIITPSNPHEVSTALKIAGQHIIGDHSPRFPGLAVKAVAITSMLDGLM
jgi:hypothetical protein